MKSIGRILRLAAPYKGLTVLNMLFNLIQVLAGLFTLTLVAPLLDVMFGNNKEVVKPKNINVNGFDFDAVYNKFITWLTEFIQEDKPKALLVICGILIVATIIKNIARYLALYFLVILRNKSIQNIRSKLYDKILSLPLSFFTNERKGDLMSRMSNDVKELEWSLMTTLDAIFKEPVTILFYVGSLIFMSPQLTLFVVILLPVAAGVIGILGRSLKRKSKKNQEAQGALLTFLEESLGGMRIIKAFVAEKIFSNKFSVINETSTKANIRVNHRGDLASPVSETLGIVVAAVVLWFGGNMVFNGELLPSVFIAYFAIFSQVIPPFKQLSNAFPMIQRGIAGMDRYEEVLNADVRIYEKADAKSISDLQNEIEFRNVSFAYGMETVINDVSFKIGKGKKVALVGASGSGKSTLADLLPRFYDLQQGEILIDNVNIKEFKLDDLRGLMGIVAQESILFNDTIASNIAFGVAGATQEKIEAAAKMANAYDFIMQAENGFKTNIGERGSKLSGGQRQRIAIARALLKDPQILILDEATSALDNESEKLVQQALDNLRQGRTILVIAHRLSTVRDADEIIVLEQGNIMERGTHNQLIALQGYYSKLYNMSISHA
ncbi:MAG: ABC transporter ATP-binding protein [Bacteroidia bacterium]|nr:ABC transporter ATP-binding protein [Bacteroidia bacterium]